MASFDFLVNGCLLVGIGVIGMIANVLCIIVVSRPKMRATSINLIVLGKYKSDNLQYNTVGQRDDSMIVPPSDGPMFILIDWE